MKQPTCMNVRIEKSMKRKIEQEADARGNMGASALVRIIIADWLKQNSEKEKK